MIRIDVELEDPAWKRALPDVRDLVRRAAAVAAGPASAGALTVLLTNDETVRGLNSRFRGRDVATNVLAFPAAANHDGHLGDIAVAFGVCEAEAKAQAKALADHTRHLIVHGVLHLGGHDHDTDDKAVMMEAVERRLLARLGVADPYLARDDVEHV